MPCSIIQIMKLSATPYSYIMHGIIIFNGCLEIPCTFAIHLYKKCNSRLTCTGDSHQSISAASRSTPRCVALTVHCGAQLGCCQVSDPSEVTPRPCHKRTCMSKWLEKGPTLTQSADSVSCNVNLTIMAIGEL